MVYTRGQCTPTAPHVSPSSSATHQVCVIRLDCDNSCNSLVRRKVKYDTLGSLHTNALFKHFREDRWRATGAGRADVFPDTTEFSRVRVRLQ